MLKRFSMILLAALAATASASGQPPVPGRYGVIWPTDPATYAFFVIDAGPPKILTCGSTVFTMDEDGVFRSAPPNGDSWSFDGNGNGTLTDWPAWPALGPPVVKTGATFAD